MIGAGIRDVAPAYQTTEIGVIPAEWAVVGVGDLKPFVIVHQWDRVPALAEKIKEIYG